MSSVYIVAETLGGGKSFTVAFEEAPGELPEVEGRMNSEMKLEEPIELVAAVDYAEGAIVSKTLGKAPFGSITLFAFEGMRCREIAQVLDAPVNTVKTLIHRARAALARALSDEEEERGNED